jgi:hypothetical protein
MEDERLDKLDRQTKQWWDKFRERSNHTAVARMGVDSIYSNNKK